MRSWRWLFTLALIVAIPTVCLVGCSDDDDDDDPPAPPPGEAGILQVTVVGAMTIDVFDAVNIQVDGTGIGSVAWPDGGTLSFPTSVGPHVVTAQASAGTRHWNAIGVDVPPEADGPAGVTLNTANSDM